MAATDVDALYEKIMSLNELVWEGRADRPAVDLWLEGFRGECTSEYDERKHALYLLSKFLYFGQTQVRQLLRSMFQDLIRHHLSAEVREGLTDKNDFAAVHQGFLEEMDRTRFVGPREASRKWTVFTLPISAGERNTSRRLCKSVGPFHRSV